MRVHLTLKENRQFQRAYRKGKSFVSAGLVTYIIKNNTNNLQIGITTSKKIGKAVQRNRCRRIIRAAFYQLENEIKSGYDFVFVARAKTPYLKSTDIYNAMRNHLQQANVLKD
ncbi:MAG: ribonuclease P protein component [Ruminococcus sp.]|nr:ribonuclease P protein component [Ruminococcus sp.]MBQ9919632.1 ribonuclease P protein component [Clostridia bacterium]